VLDINPAPPISPEDAIFTDPSAPTGFKYGGIMNIVDNTFIITDGFGSICIDRFYDTATSDSVGLTPIPVSNTRMRSFRISNNSFIYHGDLNTIPAVGSNGIIGPVTPINTTPGTAPLGQEAIRDKIYDLMIHRDLRGFVPQVYPSGLVYPDPKDGYGVADGYNIPPAGGKVTEFMIISGNSPAGLNLPDATPVGFLSETQDSVARDNHGGGTKFGSFTVPASGLPIVIDRSIDWHDRKIWAYASNLLTDSTVNGGNKLYTGTAPIQNINSGISFYQSNIFNITDALKQQTVLTGQTVDRVMSPYGAVASSHGFIHGYAARLSGDLIRITNPGPGESQFPGWSSIKYLGTFSFIATNSNTASIANNFALVVLPNGELAVLHAGAQNPTDTSLGVTTALVQTSDSYPATSDGSRAGAVPMTLSFMIIYSPKLNILTTSQYNADTAMDTLDNFGGGFGKIG
jgi:hypothetical protein